MFEYPTRSGWPPKLQTEELRKTLGCMRDELDRVPALRRAACALDLAISELEAAERGQRTAIGSDGRVVPISTFRLPSRR